MKDSQYLAMITRNAGPTKWKNKRLPVGLAKFKPMKGKRALEEIDAEKTQAFFKDLYRNCKD